MATHTGEGQVCCHIYLVFWGQGSAMVHESLYTLSGRATAHVSRTFLGSSLTVRVTQIKVRVGRLVGRCGRLSARSQRPCSFFYCNPPSPPVVSRSAPKAPPH